MLVARTADGRTVVYPVAENHHVDGILDLTVVPARVDADAGRRGGRAGRCAIAERLDYVGLLAVEMFVSDGRLLVNELAPAARTTAATGRSTRRAPASSTSRCGRCAAWPSAARS